MSLPEWWETFTNGRPRVIHARDKSKNPLGGYVVSMSYSSDDPDVTARFVVRWDNGVHTDNRLGDLIIEEAEIPL